MLATDRDVEAVVERFTQKQRDQIKKALLKQIAKPYDRADYHEVGIVAGLKIALALVEAN